MPRFLPALKFAFWTYVWTLGTFSASVLALRYSEAWRHPDAAWWSPAALWENLQAVWFLPLPIFAAALLAVVLAPRWWKSLTLLLTPALLLGWVWSPYRMPTEGLFSLMALILPAALLASVPSLIRSRRPRLSSRHD
ncbi:hypothetical protein [Deinococcus radiodurans]|uniref:hypothetical protein n=1 Tax=Deinococcus radiodurans TaxID=1299 RepID=UPI0004879C17|nr:hypothetical protein [Deinococcus radiodurans]ANC70776.1 hypothetical protein A2G07_02795 [Deinococcus radiodurans R1 = ATCC 13939 = DSM 20539]QEM71548.1 hypothetical protein DXG80_07080 [Deinococcus radiodurans]QIP27866.1 hypothetical protein HAV23_00455 [Deinococcus radiodurans]QIP31254.1 hypothetical protein HAV35_03060 [Deinococcus radiodurans]UDL01193.1 hypothetical protein E5E91_11160 [Deinococcus radiodurans R1 = ATCC 13939 = DSM 20539]